MTKAYSYARWSSAAQGVDERGQGNGGDSERRQIDAAKAYAEKHGLDLDTSHIDRGKSAYKSHHRKGHLGRFLASVRAGEIAQGSVLIVESVDRLSREPVLDALELFTELARVCTIVTLFDGMEYTRESMNADFSKLFVPIIKMSVAHEESEKKSKRKTESWIAKRQDAYASNKLMSRNCPAWIKVVDGKPVEEPKRAEIVRQIFTDLCHSGKGVIAKNLNAAGVESFKGKSWHASMIQKLVDDRRVLGEYQPHQLVKNADDTMKRVPLGEPIPNYYPQIVDPALYHRAKVAVASRRTSGASRANKATYSNLFAGLAECGQCHGPMVYRNKGDGPKGGIYLVCGAAARRYNCDNKKHYRYDHIEEGVLNSIIEVDLVEAQTLGDLEKLRGEIAETQHQKALVAKREKNAARLAVETDDDSYFTLQREYRAELKALVATIERLEGDLATLEAKPTPQGQQNALRRLREDMATADEPTLHRLRAAFSAGLKEVVDMMVCETDGMTYVIMDGGKKAYRMDEVGVRKVEALAA